MASIVLSYLKRHMLKNSIIQKTCEIPEIVLYNISEYFDKRKRFPRKAASLMIRYMNHSHFTRIEAKAIESDILLWSSQGGQILVVCYDKIKVITKFLNSLRCYKISTNK